MIGLGIALVVWVSFFPAPIHQRFSVVVRIGMIVIFLFTAVANPKNLFRVSDIPLWLFIFSIGLNVFFALQRNIALCAYFDLSIIGIALYYFFSQKFFVSDIFYLFIKIISLAGIFVSLGGVLEILFSFNPLYEYFIQNPFYNRYIVGFVRPMSTQLHPPILGSYLLWTLPFHGILSNDRKLPWRVLGRIGIILSTSVIILTFSRGVLLGLCASMGSYAIFRKRYFLLGSGLILLILMMVSFEFLPYPINRFGIVRIITGHHGLLTDYRFIRFFMSLQMVADYPFAGVGLNHFRIVFNTYYPIQAAVPYEFMIPDNMYLALLAETGFVGFLSFLIFIFFVIKKALTYRNRPQQSLRNQRIIEYMLSAFMGLLVHMAAYELFYWNNIYICFFIIIGFIESFYRWGQLS